MTNSLWKLKTWSNAFWILSLIWITFVGVLVSQGELRPPDTADIERRWAVAILEEVKREYPDFLDGLVPVPVEPVDVTESSRSSSYFRPLSDNGILFDITSFADSCEGRALTDMDCLFTQFFSKIMARGRSGRGDVEFYGPKWSMSYMLQEIIDHYCGSATVVTKPSSLENESLARENLTLHDIVRISGPQVSINCQKINERYENQIEERRYEWYGELVTFFLGPILLVYLSGRYLPLVVVSFGRASQKWGDWTRRRCRLVVQSISRGKRKLFIPDERLAPYYERAWEELNSDSVRQGLWAQVYSANNGDPKKSEAAYLRARAEQLFEATKDKT